LPPFPVGAPPERRDQLVARHHLVPSDEQQREQGPALRLCRRQIPTVVEDLEWTEEAEIGAPLSHFPLAPILARISRA